MLKLKLLLYQNGEYQECAAFHEDFEGVTTADLGRGKFRVKSIHNVVLDWGQEVVNVFADPLDRDKVVIEKPAEAFPAPPPPAPTFQDAEPEPVAAEDPILEPSTDESIQF